MTEAAVDVLVVGGGPAGLYAAARLAARGLHVLACEEHDTIGAPVHCTGILASESFAEFDLPREPALNDLAAARFFSPKGAIVPYASPEAVATVIDRPAFDRALAARAVSAGATLLTGTRVTSIETDAHGARAIVGDRVVTSRLVVLACGATYVMQRRLGLGLPHMHLQTAQAELRADAPPATVELYFGRGVAADGFAWIVPVHRPGGTHVRIGVMASGDALGCYRRFFARVRERCGIPAGDVIPRQKILPLGPITRTYADRMLVVGDAAGLVKPTTGGGIHYSIVSAAIAADVAGDALARDRVAASDLAVYEHRWRAKLGDELQTQTDLRRAVTRLSDEEIEGLFELAQTDGIMPIVRATMRFNEHRTLIRALFAHPPARRFFFRAMVG